MAPGILSVLLLLLLVLPLQFILNRSMVSLTQKSAELDHGREQALLEASSTVLRVDFRELLKELRHDQGNGHDSLTAKRRQSQFERAIQPHPTYSYPKRVPPRVANAAAVKT